MSKKWSTADIGDLRGKQAIVTGANSGIGYHTALELGRAGAQVVIACRDAQRGEEALAPLRQEAVEATFGSSCSTWRISRRCTRSPSVTW
ncbi:MAG: putative oxidoreductase/Short-chain dehydrogenase [bacterium]|nr:putative oxidoreductase/Short-chain dehydrogenase [bacterium]